jgi:DNA modification methylase
VVAPADTQHLIYNSNAQLMPEIADNSVALVVTSPPYPMIEMWDEQFIAQNPAIKFALEAKDGITAQQLMHQLLYPVWKALARVVMPGGIICINIGDATRTLHNTFRLYANHSLIINAFLELGLTVLPAIIWKKSTNAPTKFMGSGMLPTGAYITLEHEWILIFRKNGKRCFVSAADKVNRRASAFFWQERNNWFSDIWKIKGTDQQLIDSKARHRSGAFPIEIPYRLIHMFSVKNDWILDPFSGTGTTTLAAIASQRNSIGYEIMPALASETIDRIANTPIDFFNNLLIQRLNQQIAFIQAQKVPLNYTNRYLNLSVKTRQETDIQLFNLAALEKVSYNRLAARYQQVPIVAAAAP